ncbi:MAG: hypothetical protein JWM11_7706 [Planctomycetaceae bacterium]|nr:hypothetical protein [Planctomycetaceae bacterium]
MRGDSVIVDLSNGVRSSNFSFGLNPRSTVFVHRHADEHRTPFVNPKLKFEDLTPDASGLRNPGSGNPIRIVRAGVLARFARRLLSCDLFDRLGKIDLRSD